MFYKKIRIIKDDKLLEGKISMYRLSKLAGVSESTLSKLKLNQRMASEEMYNKLKSVIISLKEVDK